MSKLKLPITNTGDTKMKDKPTNRKMEFKDNLAKVGEFYYYRFSYKGKVHLGSTGKAAWMDARTELIKIKKRIADEQDGNILSKEIPTFSEAVQMWYDNKKGKKSDKYVELVKDNLTKHVIPKLGNIKCNMIDNDIAEIVLNDYLHGYNKQYPNIKHTLGGYNVLAAHISVILGSLVPRYLDYAPKIIQEKLQKKRKKYIPIARTDEFLEIIDRYNNLHVSVCVRAMLYMGLREDEAIHLKHENINFEELTYCPDKTKGKEAVDLAFPEDMKVWFQKVKKSKSEYMLLAEDGLPHRKQFTRKAIERAGREMEIKLSPHRMRDTYATGLAKIGKSSIQIKDCLRHKDIQTSEGYVTLELEDRKRACADLWGKKKA